jgi:hypothetical protein
MDEADAEDPRSDFDPAVEARRGLDPAAVVCGNCMVWRATHQDDRERWVGPCRLMPDRGDLPATAAPCDRFIRKGGPLPEAPPPEKTRRRSRTLRGGDPVIRRPGGTATAGPAGATTARAAGTSPTRPAPRPAGPRPLEDPDREVLDMTKEELLDVLQDFFAAGPVPRMAAKWEGGRLVIQAGDDGLAPKEVPLDVFFKKLVRVRDQLRLLEQKVNGHERLTGSEKVELQAYLTRCYGAMTTFNVLFRDAEDRFVGEKGGG